MKVDDAVCDVLMCRTRCGEVSSQRYLQTEACVVAGPTDLMLVLEGIKKVKKEKHEKRGTPFPHADRRRVDLSERGSRGCVYSAWPSLPNFKFSWGGGRRFLSLVCPANALNSRVQRFLSGALLWGFLVPRGVFLSVWNAMINRNCNDGLEEGNDRIKNNYKEGGAV